VTSHILLVEDEPVIRRTVSDALRANGYLVSEARDGEAGESIALREAIDLVLLDVMLPGKSGFEVLRALRSDRLAIPIVLLTARGEEADRVQGFEYGADDYVMKPFSMQELLLRVKALLTRADGGAPGVSGITEVVRFGDTEVDFQRFTVRCGRRRSGLSRRELELLEYLMRRDGETVDRTQILDDVWSPDNESTTRTVDQHVLKLRKKIEADPKAPRHLLTVRGVGYRFTRVPLTD
jgi:DNA-binding response OmpR family regulator